MLKKILDSTLLRSSVIYTVSSVINAAIPFLIMPVLTRHLTPADYGIVSMMTVLVGIVSPFVGLNIHGAISVRFFDAANRDLPRYIGNCVLLLFGSTTLVSIVLWALVGPISGLTAFPRQWFAFIILLAFGQFVTLVLLTVWPSFRRSTLRVLPRGHLQWRGEEYLHDAVR